VCGITCKRDEACEWRVGPWRGVPAGYFVCAESDIRGDFGDDCAPGFSIGGSEGFYVGGARGLVGKV
jgi:hypothetical protein